MEIRLKDESGKSIDTLLEKSIALTNEVQVPPTPESPDILKDVEIELETVPEHKVLNTEPKDDKGDAASGTGDDADKGGVVGQIKDASEKLVSVVCEKKDEISAKAEELASASKAGLEDAGKKLKEMASGLVAGKEEEQTKVPEEPENKSYKEKIISMAGDLLSTVMSESERIVQKTKEASEEPKDTSKTEVAAAEKSDEGKTGKDSNAASAADDTKAQIDEAKEALSVAVENLNDKLNQLLPTEARESAADKSKEIAEALSEKVSDAAAEAKEVASKE